MVELSRLDLLSCLPLGGRRIHGYDVATVNSRHNPGKRSILNPTGVIHLERGENYLGWEAGRQRMLGGRCVPCLDGVEGEW
jgi:hypothetical protein